MENTPQKATNDALLETQVSSIRTNKAWTMAAPRSLVYQKMASSDAAFDSCGVDVAPEAAPVKGLEALRTL